jgi:hypothetical protein
MITAPPAALTASIGLDHTRQLDPKASQLLHRIAFLHPRRIPLELARCSACATCAAPASIPKPLLILDQLGLAHVDYDDRSFSVPEPTQAILREGLEGAERRHWWEQAVVRVAEALPAVASGYSPQIERLLPHVRSVIRWGAPWPDWPEAAETLREKTADYLHQRGRLREAVELGRTTRKQAGRNASIL